MCGQCSYLLPTSPPSSLKPPSMPTTTMAMSMSMPAKLCQFQSHSSSPNWVPLPTPVQFRPRKALEPSRLTSSASRRRITLPVLRAVATSVVASAPPTTTSESDARTLYIGNIPRSVTSDELTSIVQEHGAVEKAEVMYDKYSKRSRRFGFAIMKTVEDASAAIEKLNGTEIGGRKIKVNITEKPLSGADADVSLLETEESQFVDSPHKVYVGNLSKTVTTDILKSYFSAKGNVLSAKVSRVPGTSKLSGFGFVTFSSEEDVESAISSFNNAYLEGQKIRVNKAS